MLQTTKWTTVTITNIKIVCMLTSNVGTIMKGDISSNIVTTVKAGMSFVLIDAATKLHTKGTI